MSPLADIQTGAILNVRRFEDFGQFLEVVLAASSDVCLMMWFLMPACEDQPKHILIYIVSIVTSVT